MVGGEGLKPVPEQLAGLVGDGKIRKPFIVEQGVLAGDLDADGADGFMLRIFDHLEFLQAFFQFIRRLAHRMPDLPEPGKIIDGRAADADLAHECRILVFEAGNAKGGIQASTCPVPAVSPRALTFEAWNVLLTPGRKIDSLL
jgi:hypothetical protein